MLIDSVIASVLSYLIMLWGYSLRKRPALHVPIMVSVMIFDVLMPFYLYATRDWKVRLIDDGDILSFAVWTHLGLLVSLFTLYGLQVVAGRRLWSGDETLRKEHGNLAVGILIVRALVIISGMMLIQSQDLVVEK